MIPRYQSTTMKDLWSDENKYQTWFKVELAFLKAYLREHNIYDSTLLAKLCKWQAQVDWMAFARQVDVYEQECKHDVIAFLSTLESELGEDARLFHMGLTSSDVLDTGFALLLRQASCEIDGALQKLIKSLWRKAYEMRGVLCLGRTHGKAAEPMTFAIKLLSHCAALVRGAKLLRQAQKEISVGKFSGAIGIYTYVNSATEESALKALGLGRESVATQVVARDRHATFFCALAILGGSVERLALELRLLSHSGLQEASEPFLHGQKGSSAMPHKKNPILAENVTGLMRLLRSYAQAALEDQALWHERDISHSSVERVIAPDATSILEFALARLSFVIEELVVDKDRMAAHVTEVGEILYSQAVMLALVEKGMGRKDAYNLVQQAAHHPAGNFISALKKCGIAPWLNDNELNAIFSNKASVAEEQALFERVRDDAHGIIDL